MLVALRGKPSFLRIHPCAKNMSFPRSSGGKPPMSKTAKILLLACCTRRKLNQAMRVGNPRRETAYGAIGQLAENVLTLWELRSPLNAKVLTM